MRVILVKVVGEVSNSNHTTEHFRVYKLADLIIDPILHSNDLQRLGDHLA